METTFSHISKQRDRYMQLIEMINATPFDEAYTKYKQVSLADTDITWFEDWMLTRARRLACAELGLPITD